MALNFLQKLGGMFKSKRVDVAERFQLLREAVSGTMSSFYMARDRTTGKTVGLKILDQEKTAVFEARFKGLKKPSEGDIALRTALGDVVYDAIEMRTSLGYEKLRKIAAGGHT
jgi:serine/threonine-protein kinase